MSETFKPFRVLTFDGGVAGSLYPRLLRDVLSDIRQEFADAGEEYPGFFSQVELFAGASAGAMSATYLSVLLEKYPNDDYPTWAEAEGPMMDDWVTFADTAFQYCCGGKQAIINLLSFDSPALDVQPLADFLSESYEGKTMAQLKVPVLLVSYRVKFGGEDPPMGRLSFPVNINRFRSRVADNVLRETELPTYGDALASDLVLQSAAFPLFFPIQQSHLDGCLTSPNPAANALSELVQLSRISEEPRLQNLSMDDIVLMSWGSSVPRLGEQFGDIVQPSDDSWGIWKWMGPYLFEWTQMVQDRKKDESYNGPLLTDGEYQNILSHVQQEPFEYLLIVTALFNAMAQNSDLLCENLLQPNNYLRVAPPTMKGMGRMMMLILLGAYELLLNDADEVAESWSDYSNPRRYRPAIQGTKQWIYQRWFLRPEPKNAST